MFKVAKISIKPLFSGHYCLGLSKRLPAMFKKPFVSLPNNISRLLIKTPVVKMPLRNTMSVRLVRDKSKFGKDVVGYWLLGCGGMVFVAVVLGGVTRLTESGLSMVTWKLLGESHPSTNKEWELEFERYQQYPEFKLMNKEMTIDEFKFIFRMEYAHRMWGRLIGACFLIPASIFWARGMFTKSMKIRVGIFGTLIGLQGLMGWYMVKSGLDDKFIVSNDIPRVSHYRLASHLSLAFILYTLFMWSALDHLVPVIKNSAAVTKAALNFRRLAHVCKGMIFLTAISGAFVAGLDAGLVYNSFPKMSDKWVPDDILTMSPKIRNITENPTTVQFNHRVLGSTTLGLITVMWYLSRKTRLPPRAYIAASAVGTMAWLQVVLGITTLLNYVPVTLAACHQSGSLLLLSFTIWLSHELKHLKKLPK